MPEYNAKIAAIAMPARIKRLPISPTGFPVPWFVHWEDGVPEFRMLGKNKIADAWRRKLCWVCGEPLGRIAAMTLGPMCAINRTISEPPSHRDCAVYSAIACPFLSNPRMRRNSEGLPDHVPPAGMGIERNPGAVAVWMTRGYRPLKAPIGQPGVLFTFDDPTEVLWFAHGRAATRQEVEASIDSGLPELEAIAIQEGRGALQDLRRLRTEVTRYLPSA